MFSNNIPFALLMIKVLLNMIRIHCDIEFLAHTTASASSSSASDSQSTQFKDGVVFILNASPAEQQTFIEQLLELGVKQSNLPRRLNNEYNTQER